MSASASASRHTAGDAGRSHRTAAGQQSGSSGTQSRKTEQEQADWTARLQAAVAKTIAARQARRDLRAQLQARRDVGLTRRHHTKLNRKDTP